MYGGGTEEVWRGLQKVVQSFEEMKRSKKHKIVYCSGYDHYSHRRTIQITFFVNEAEKNALDDLMAVLEEKNMSEFIRGQLFRAYEGLTAEQKERLAEVAEWREKEGNL